jgi:hypothetical protein
MFGGQGALRLLIAKGCRRGTADRNMATNRDQPNPLRDAIAVVFRTGEEPVWTVYRGSYRHGEYLTQTEAQLAAEEIANKHGVDAWVQLGLGKYKRL